MKHPPYRIVSLAEGHHVSCNIDTGPFGVDIVVYHDEAPL